MNRKRAVVCILTAVCIIGAAMPGVGQAQDAKVKTAMDLLHFRWLIN